MLDSDTKRRINTCRDILVGKVPDPKSQVEQITIALIYKFMDDMDLESEEMGGARTFFAGEFERYAWAKLVAPGVGGQEMLNTYTEALTKMVENPGIPELFRSIFRNAYLPYRDPETLRSFLREINGFTYDHSERLGDAFEYLLSVLGSQGDAGQFRTPRHIIDFMVEIIDPKKDEVILDPACGTAGFLISSYKHILKANSTDAGSNGAGVEVDAAEATLDSPLRYPGDLLTTEDRQRLARNIKGYDISPDMVRLSLVNLYLHGFADPKVEEYDTLTSDEKWGETADVILANPPFMSPKGGIKPHNRFGVPSKRSEVLFVDYIAEHLNPKGRAAIVVPEGIIFQSQSAYCDLRRMLVDKYLAAVISLPAGVFNPYSGVKTSILILDRAVAKASDSIAFFRIENDGFGLGAQRRAVKGSQLSQVKAELCAWLDAARGGLGTALDSALGFAVDKARIAEGGEHNLSGERYRQSVVRTSAYDFAPLGNLMASKVPMLDPSKHPDERFELWSIPSHESRTPEILLGRDIGSAKKCVQPGDVLLSRIVPHIRRSWVVTASMRGYPQIASGEWIIFRGDEVNPHYLSRMLVSDRFHEQFMRTTTGVGGSLTRANPKAVADIEIPLPPLDVQREIVAEIEGYQKVIDGARAVLENYRPHIPIDPACEMVTLGDASETVMTGPFGTSLKESDYTIEGIPVVNPKNIVDGAISTDGIKRVPPETVQRLSEFMLKAGDVIIGRRGEMGRCAVIQPEMEGWLCGTGCFVIRPEAQCLPEFIAMQVSSPTGKRYLDDNAVGVTMKNLNQSVLAGMPFARPPFEIQQAIVAEMKAEQALVEGNRELIARFEKKIEAAIARVWGGGKETVAA